MKLSPILLWALASNIGLGQARPWEDEDPYAQWQRKAHRYGLEVDLGYERYLGETNVTTGLSYWKGMRYAAPPTGTRRFQSPEVPAINRSAVLPADEFQTECIQGNGIDSGSEDCLYLNVHAPANAKDLPVIVFIHGGAYQIGNGAIDPTDFIVNNKNRFVAVFIQYRLGVFGFVPSDDIRRYGQLNAGLLDMELSLQWVKTYIHLFGGDASRVTIAGESAGGGAVMLFSMLYGGTIGTSLFEQGIAASPYLPRQFVYNAAVPSYLYDQLLNFTNCGNTTSAKSRFDCLVGLDSTTLSAAGSNVDGIQSDFLRGFAPVTDGIIIQDLPSRQLRPGRVNGKRMLAGNNANEGVIFVPGGISTSDDFDAYVAEYFTEFTDYDVAQLKKIYPASYDYNSSMTGWSTTGTSPPTALTFSDWSNGEQQRAFNLQAESVLDCPAYWLADSYPGHGWKYEFSVPPAYHSFDTQAYFYSDNDHPAFTQDFVVAFQNIWGNFIVHGDPRISYDIACGSNCTRKPTPQTDIERSWIPYCHSAPRPVHLAVNVTGGEPAECSLLFVGNAACSQGPGVKNWFRVANADTWEGGRGARCDFWREVGPRVPG